LTYATDVQKLNYFLSDNACLVVAIIKTKLMKYFCLLAFFSLYIILGWNTPEVRAGTAQNLKNLNPDISIKSGSLLFNERVIPLTEPVTIMPGGEPALLLKDVLYIFGAQAQLNNNGVIVLQIGSQAPVYITENHYWQPRGNWFISPNYESEIYISIPVICDSGNYFWESKEKLKTIIIYSADYMNHLLYSRQTLESASPATPPQASWGAFEYGSYLAQLWPYANIAAGYYTTIFDRSPNRLVNLNLACELINGTTVAPEESFSFNQTVGPRSSARGFRVAKIFNRDEIIDGLGGGICQVSSTLYNCALAASLEIIERHPHSLRVNYVAYQQDATVSWGALDFRFRNTSDQTITIFCQVYEKYVVFAMIPLN